MAPVSDGIARHSRTALGVSTQRIVFQACPCRSGQTLTTTRYAEWWDIRRSRRKKFAGRQSGDATAQRGHLLGSDLRQLT